MQAEMDTVVASYPDHKLEGHMIAGPGNKTKSFVSDMSDNQVSYLKTSSQGSCLLIRSAHYRSVHVIWFDPVRGTPIFSGIDGFDTFSSYEEAAAHLRSKTIVEKEQGLFLIGVTVIASRLHISFVTTIEDCGHFLGSNHVYRIVSTNTIHFQLTDSLKRLPSDVQMLKNFSDFPISDFHFFCPGFDLTSPLAFPLNTDMVWNLALRRPFDALPIANPCIVLLQRAFFQLALGRIQLSIIVRRRCKGSTGSLACGLDAAGNVQNETEIEIIGQRASGAFLESVSYCYLRSSTPIVGAAEAARTGIKNEMAAPRFLGRVLD
jgi:hypothetical protein